MKVFLVDDDEMFQKSFDQYVSNLPNLPVRMTCYNSGEDCIKNLSQKPDVVVLDYMLGAEDRKAMNGIEVLEKIRQYSTETAVIMLSGKASLEIVAEAMKRGAVDFIEKNELAFSKVERLIGDAIQALFLFGIAGNTHYLMSRSGNRQPRQISVYRKTNTFFSPITLPDTKNKKLIRPKPRKPKSVIPPG